MSRASIRDRLAKATPGPWHRGEHRVHAIFPAGPIQTTWAVAEVRPNIYGDSDDPSMEDQDESNIALIAHAPTDIAALLAVADAAALSRDGMGSLLWVANNLHNHKTETFREFMEAALEDWRKGYDALASALAALEAQP